MRPFRAALLVVPVAVLAAAAPASAYVSHTVAPGESLWQLAAASNMTTRAFAAANGLSPDAQVVLGSTIRIPSVAEAAVALTAVGPAAASAPAAAPAVTATAAAGAPPALGGYTVRPGDSLSALAARARIPVAQMAYANGIKPDAWLITGTVLKLPTGAPAPAGASQPAPAAVVAPASPQPTPGRLTSGQIGQIAASDGVPSSLAAAVAWQESGFNNAMVSGANARGVMQVMPGTWDWVQRTLAHRTLDPASATDNVHAGTLFLGNLLRETGGDPRLAAAGYYQGLASVRRIGMLPETQRYVDNVMALRPRFGG